MEGWLIFFGIIGAIWFIAWLNNRVSSYEESKRLYKEAEARRAENAMIQEILNGFDVDAEREKIINRLKQSLPEGYRCGKRECDGILLKLGNSDCGSFYSCSKCHNFRSMIRMPRSQP